MAEFQAIGEIFNDGHFSHVIAVVRDHLNDTSVEQAAVFGDACSKLNLVLRAVLTGCQDTKLAVSYSW